MVVYHGTHTQNALRIQVEGFVPRAKRVWFTKDVNYARRRAKTKAGRSNGRPVVLTCKLNLPALRKNLGSRGVVQQGHVVVISGHVPASVITRNTAQPIPRHQELANWINTVLGVKPHKGVSPKEPGVDRIAHWIKHRMDANPTGTINQKELLQIAQQWLPEHFQNVRIDFDQLRAFPRPISPETTADFTEPNPTPDTYEEEALDLLLSDKPKQRIRGMALLSQCHPPDLFDWCAIFLDNNDLEMRVLTLETMVQCDDVDAPLVEPLTEDKNKRIRAGAIAVLAHHGGDEAADWFRFGLTDPDTHVRIQTARLLEDMDPQDHRPLFELALYDPNSKIAEIAQKLTHGKGFTKQTW